jgi:phosphoribosyl 1,2-cyclic phosphodiesterase
MKLKVINSNSKGNCYVLTSNDGSMLLIECGVHIDKIKQAVNFDLNAIVGCILSHSHQDHCKSAEQLTQLGINIYTSPCTKQSLKFESRNVIAVPNLKNFKIGDFTIKPFDCKHDVEIFGFLIHHEEMGMMLFMTDTYYCEYVFNDLNNIIIEANYCENILNDKTNNNGFVRDRVIQSHMSLQTCIKTLGDYNLRDVNNIVVIHLSDSNSDEKLFYDEIKKATGKNIHIADSGMEINLDITPF